MPQDVILECPFCNKKTIHAIYIPSHLGHETSRISAGAKTKYFRVPESYEIKSGCESCGKSLKEVKNAFEGKKSMTHEERIAMLKKRGLPLIIGEKK